MYFITYLRMSTDTQSDSPDTQRRLLAEWAQHNNHIIVEECLDESLSGGLPAIQRPAAARLLAMVSDKHRHFDGILVIRLDRLARDAEDRIGLLRYLAKHKCPIWTPAGEEKMDSPTDGLMQRITAAVDQYEREITGTRIREHNLARALAGKMPSGQTPLGYVYHRESETVLLSDRADDARAIFRWFVDCMGNAAEVARRANQAGMRGTRGAAFCQSAILKLLRNSIYRRQITYAGRVVDAAHTIPVLIDSATLAEVDRLLARYTPMPSRAKEIKRAYSGHLTCGTCGGKLHHCLHRVFAGNGTRYSSWRCYNQVKGTCDFKIISGRYLDRLIQRALTQFVAQLAISEPVVNTIQPVDHAARRHTLESRRAKWAEMYADDLISRDLMRKRIADVDAELAKLTPGDAEQTPPPVVFPQEMHAYLRETVQQWPALHEEERRQVLVAIGAHIEVTSRYGEARQVILTTQTAVPPITVRNQKAYKKLPPTNVYG